MRTLTLFFGGLYETMCKCTLEYHYTHMIQAYWHKKNSYLNKLFSAYMYILYFFIMTLYFITVKIVCTLVCINVFEGSSNKQVMEKKVRVEQNSGRIY